MSNLKTDDIVAAVVLLVNEDKPATCKEIFRLVYPPDTPYELPSGSRSIHYHRLSTRLKRLVSKEILECAQHNGPKLIYRRKQNPNPNALPDIIDVRPVSNDRSRRAALATLARFRSRASVPGIESPHLKTNQQLQLHVNQIINALETLQEHIGPTLALLLDMDKDFERFGKVKDLLATLKRATEIEL